MNRVGLVRTTFATVRGLAALGLDAALGCECALCGAPAARDGVCAACDAQALRDASRIRCSRCGVALAPAAHTEAIEEQTCARCIASPPEHEAARCGLDYAPPYDRLAIALKFSARLAAARPLSLWLARAAMAPPRAVRIDAVVAVPLARERLAQRGFNQARAIAAPFAQALRAPLRDDLLERVTHHAPVATLKHEARAREVRGAFSAHRCAGLRIALVDDVMTTGATMHEAARALKAAGAVHIVACAALRTPRF